MNAFDKYMNEIVTTEMGAITLRRQLYSIPRIRFAKEDFEAGYIIGYERALQKCGHSRQSLDKLIAK